MSNDINDELKETFSMLESEAIDEKSLPGTRGEWMKKFFLAGEVVVIILLVACFIVCFFILTLNVSGVGLVYSSVFLNISLNLICLLSVLLLISKNRERRRIYQLYGDIESKFPVENRIKFRDYFCVIPGVVDSLCNRDATVLRLALIECRHQLSLEFERVGLFSINSNFLPFAFSFVVFSWNYFFKSIVRERIDSLPEVLSSIPWAVPLAEKNWLKIYGDHEFNVVVLFSIAVVVYYLYKRLDARKIARKLYLYHVIKILECAICIKSEKEGKVQSIPMSPPQNQDQSMFFLSQLRNFVCKRIST